MTVPTLFEDYWTEWDRTAQPQSSDRDTCTSCLRKVKPLTRDGYCRECVRYDHGYDQAEEIVTTVLIGGAVKAALEAGVSSELVTLAVHRAVEEHRESEADEMYRQLTRKAA